jgi:hypothetical protein
MFPLYALVFKFSAGGGIDQLVISILLYYVLDSHRILSYISPRGQGMEVMAFTPSMDGLKRAGIARFG